MHISCENYLTFLLIKTRNVCISQAKFSTLRFVLINILRLIEFIYHASSASEIS